MNNIRTTQQLDYRAESKISSTDETMANDSSTSEMDTTTDLTIDDQANSSFQPTIVIAAEIAFAALLLYMTNQPIDLGTNTMMAEAEPVITISIPANAAIAGTAELTTTEIASAVEITPPLLHTSH